MNKKYDESKSYKRTYYYMIFILILSYISFPFIKFISNENYNYVPIENGYIQEIDSYFGVIYKDETVFYSPIDGIVEYYYLESEKVKSNALIANISVVKNINEIKEKVQLLENKYVYSNNQIDNGLEHTQEIDDINNNLNYFVNSYINNRSNYSFEYNYNFKDKLNSKLISRNNLFMMYNNKRAKDILIEKNIYKEQLYTSTKNISTTKSGIISYYFDNYEELDLLNLTYEKFKELEKQEIDLQNLQNEIINKGDPIIKTINSTYWSIFTVLPKDISDKYLVGDTIKFKAKTINVELQGEIIFKETINDECFIKISFSNFLNKVMDKRFISFEITDNIINGYKIPKSSIVEQAFYCVPLKYIHNSNSSIGIIKQDSENEKFIPITTEYVEGDYIYFDITTKGIDINDKIINTENNQSSSILKVEKLTGVYIINNGYKKFRIINSLYSNDDYSIVKKNTKYGLKLYDRIIQDGSPQKND